jgi:PIN domain nuclease of toxin-antitoxin system
VKILLDTHVVLWWAAGDRRLRKSSRDLIASAENDVAVSAASLWEIAIKKNLGRIAIDIAELREAIAADGFEELPIRFAHALRLDSLPDRHGDPFDRMLIAQTIAEGRQLLTSDEAILGYSDVPGFAVLRA